jgi:hypothetical protein
MGLFDWSFTNNDALIFPKLTCSFYQYGTMVVLPFATYIQYKSKVLGQGYGTNCGVILKDILDAHS